jgi:hypothetical protein
MPSNLAREAFVAMSRRSQSIPNLAYLQLCIKALGKVMTKFKFEREANIFVTAMMNRKWQHFPELCPYHSEVLTRFMGKYISLFAVEAPVAVEFYLKNYAKQPMAAMERYLFMHLLAIAVEHCPSVTEGKLRPVFIVVAHDLKEASVQQLPIVCGAVELLYALWTRCSDACKGMDECLSLTLQWVGVVSVDAQEIQVGQELIRVVPRIARLWALVHSSNFPAGHSKRVQCDSSEFKSILKFMPFGDSCKEQGEILERLLRLCLLPGYEFMVKEICRIIVEFLVLDARDLEKFGLEDKLVTKMRFVLKKFVVGNKAMIAWVKKRMINVGRDGPVLDSVLEENK